jgi:hypothetical protein
MFAEVHSSLSKHIMVSFSRSGKLGIPPSYKDTSRWSLCETLLRHSSDFDAERLIEEAQELGLDASKIQPVPTSQNRCLEG